MKRKFTDYSQVKSLALTASAISAQYGVKIEESTNGSAYTDGNTIYIPFVDPKDEEQEVHLNGYIDHESGHIRFTDSNLPQQVFAGKKNLKGEDALLRSMWNFFEDVHVEKNMGDCFPGCRRNLTRLAVDLFTDPETKPNGPKMRNLNKDAALMGLMHYSSLRSRAQLTPALSDMADAWGAFTEKNYPGLVAKLDPILTRSVTDGTSTSSTLTLAQEMVTAVKQYIEEQDMQEYGDGEGEGEPDENGEECEQGEGTPEPGEGTPEPGKGKSSKGQPKQGGKMQKAVEELEERDYNFFDEALHAAVRQDVRKAQPKSSRYNMQVATHRQMTPILDPVRVQQQTSRLFTRMQALLQAKALKRQALSHQGRLDTGRLHKVATGDSKVFRRRTDRHAVNTEVLVAVDMSGSMSGNPAILAGEACYALIRCLKSIPNVKAGAFGFETNNIIPIIGLNDSMHDRFRFRVGGDTPLGGATEYALRTFSRKHDRQILLILTDGGASDSSFFTKKLEQARKIGVELVGVGIMDENIRHYIPEDSFSISNLPELAPLLFGVLQRKLLEV